jgi:hypothetical protein
VRPLNSVEKAEGGERPLLKHPRKLRWTVTFALERPVHLLVDRCHVTRPRA